MVKGLKMLIYFVPELGFFKLLCAVTFPLALSISVR